MRVWPCVVRSNQIFTTVFHSLLLRKRALSGKAPPLVLGLTWLAIVGGMLVFNFVVASGVPFFNDLAALAGALNGGVMMCGYPPLLYLRACHHKKVKVQTLDWALCWFLLLLFLLPVVTVLGTYSAIYDIVTDAGDNPPPFHCGNASGSIS